VPPDDERLVMAGTVLKAVESDKGRSLDIVITFDLINSIADRLRRYVMRAQILARRVAADAPR
jgi:hypothetical protein